MQRDEEIGLAPISHNRAKLVLTERGDRITEPFINLRNERTSSDFQTQTDRRKTFYVEDSRGRVTKPVVIKGWLYGQKIEEINQTTNALFTDPEVNIVLLMTIYF